MTDFSSECVVDFGVTLQGLARICRICANPTCDRSRGKQSLWRRRMETQAERLLTDPNFADPKDPRFASIRETKFPDTTREAARREASNRRADWAVPTDAETEALVDRMTLVDAEPAIIAGYLK